MEEMAQNSGFLAYLETTNLFPLMLKLDRVQSFGRAHGAKILDPCAKII
jgi:hypothetical protein